MKILKCVISCLNSEIKALIMILITGTLNTIYQFYNKSFYSQTDTLSVLYIAKATPPDSVKSNTLKFCAWLPSVGVNLSSSFPGPGTTKSVARYCKQRRTKVKQKTKMEFPTTFTNLNWELPQIWHLNSQYEFKNYGHHRCTVEAPFLFKN